MIGHQENSAQRNIDPTPITQPALCSIMAFAGPLLVHFYCKLLGMLVGNTTMTSGYHQAKKNVYGTRNSAKGNCVTQS